MPGCGGRRSNRQRCRHRARMVSIVMPRARRNCSCTLGRSSRAAQQGQPGGARNNQPNRSQLTNQDFDLQAKGTSMNLLRVGLSPCEACCTDVQLHFSANMLLRLLRFLGVPCNRPLLSSLTYEAYIGSGETTSVIDTINRRAHKGKLAGTYPYSSKQSNPALLRATRLQLRCNLDPRRNVRTRFFHRFCMPAGPMERAPV